jgi:hypothetical protein
VLPILSMSIDVRCELRRNASTSVVAVLNAGIDVVDLNLRFTQVCCYFTMHVTVTDTAPGVIREFNARH